VPPHAATTARQQGFTLVEVMVASVVLLVGILGTFSMVDAAQRTTRANNARTAVSGLAREILEQSRALDYEQIAPSTLVGLLRAKSGLAGQIDSQNRWLLTRKGVRMAVTASVCTFDDPMDGLSALAPADSCPPAAAVAGTPAETNPDDFRRVSLTIAWADGGVSRSTTQTGLVANPGGGIGPRITSFPDPFALQVTAAVNIPFVVNTTAAASVRWTADDGISAGDASGGPSIWGMNWNVGTVGVGTWTVDGTYTINAQPYDSRGVPGEMRVATVLLNRRVPMAPSSLAGGRSQYDDGVVELEWAAARERDVLGYRVYRVNASGPRTRVCPSAAGDAVSTATVCTDSHPPGSPALLYQVVAVDRPTLGDPNTGTREGDASYLTVSSLGVQPSAPATVQASVVDGRVQLSWTPSVVGPALFYRIYRDGVRLDHTVSPTPSYVDADPGATTSHRYAISAVGATYNESPLSPELVSP
jgi:prepilin-type N-terminal cleavage/methylation domain-containing protein